LAGIYIHIPFCKKRCHYCDFYSVVNLSYIDSYFEAIIKELYVRRSFFNKKNVDSIYIGGGTPSIVPLKKISDLLENIKNYYFISDSSEITIEVNPEDTSVEYYKDLKKVGINRLSIGVQSFDDEFLKFLNRRNDGKKSIESIENAIEAGFENINIDLIYGIPGCTNDKWIDTLNKAFSLPVKHLSAYHLSIEPNTTFGIMMEKGSFSPINEEDSWIQFLTLHELAKEYIFEHYEISNLSKAGFRSKHNYGYWKDNIYLGIGASAHSYDGEKRILNISKIDKYISNLLNEDFISQEIDKLTEKDKINEFIMTSLRCKEGINIADFIGKFGQENLNMLEVKIKKYIPTGYVVIDKNDIRLTLKGWFISDTIISELFYD